MYNQLKSEFLKLKYSKLFIAVPILFFAGLILYGSFSMSAGGTQLFVSEGDEELFWIQIKFLFTYCTPNQCGIRFLQRIQSIESYSFCIFHPCRGSCSFPSVCQSSPKCEANIRLRRIKLLHRHLRLPQQFCKQGSYDLLFEKLYHCLMVYSIA